jgi:hypothetical protein
VAVGFLWLTPRTSHDRVGSFPKPYAQFRSSNFRDSAKGVEPRKVQFDLTPPHRQSFRYGQPTPALDISCRPSVSHRLLLSLDAWSISVSKKSRDDLLTRARRIQVDSPSQEKPTRCVTSTLRRLWRCLRAVRGRPTLEIVIAPLLPIECRVSAGLIAELFLQTMGDSANRKKAADRRAVDESTSTDMALQSPSRSRPARSPSPVPEVRITRRIDGHQSISIQAPRKHEQRNSNTHDRQAVQGPVPLGRLLLSPQEEHHWY